MLLWEAAKLTLCSSKHPIFNIYWLWRKDASFFR